MSSYRAYTGRADWTAPDGDRGSFRPIGQIVQVGDDDLLDARANPALWRSRTPTWSARLFVGLYVGSKKKWKLDDVVRIVHELLLPLTAQDPRDPQRTAKPGASFLAGKGLYRMEKGNYDITEDSVQVVLIDVWGWGEGQLRENAEIIAEELAQRLRQREVFVEIQRRGVATEVISVGA